MAEAATAAARKQLERPDPYGPAFEPKGEVVQDSVADEPMLTGDPEFDELELAATSEDAVPFSAEFLRGL